MTSLILRGPVFAGGKVTDTSVRVEDGVIVAVSDGDVGRAERVVTLTAGQTLVPAAVDTLCALRDWAEAPRDTVETVTKAALAGGVTVVCDQANTVPRIDSPELIRQRSELVASRSYVDFAIQAHPPADFRRVDEYREAGALISLFQWDLRPWNYPRDIDDSVQKFRRFAELGLKGLIFPDELALRETPLEGEGESYALEALLRRLHPDFHVRLFVTLPASVERILATRERLPNVLIQTAPHYLFMSREAALARIGSAAAHSPPLRPASDVARFQECAAAGQLDILVSHHTPHRTGDKHSSEPIPGEFTPKRGFSSIDFAYPLCLTRLGIAAACRMFSENPAKHLGIRKGRIAPGYDGDFTVIEERRSVALVGAHEGGSVQQDLWQIEPERFQSLGKVTPFVGERLKYRIVKTFLRGEEAYDAATATFRRYPVRQIR
jgi:dihydroorotase-like cyclic amidohydrolase